MINLKGQKYVQGAVDISPAALSRLNTLEIFPSVCHDNSSYEGFYLPLGNDGGEFTHRCYGPAVAGDLWLKSEAPG